MKCKCLLFTMTVQRQFLNILTKDQKNDLVTFKMAKNGPKMDSQKLISNIFYSRMT